MSKKDDKKIENSEEDNVVALISKAAISMGWNLAIGSNMELDLDDDESDFQAIVIYNPKYIDCEDLESGLDLDFSVAIPPQFREDMQ